MNKPIPQLSKQSLGENHSDSFRPCVLTVAGIDPAGMAGMAMDIRTQAAMGAHTLPIVSCNTVQNNAGVSEIGVVSSDHFKKQLFALNTYPVKAIKIGLVGSKAQAEHIVNFIKGNQSELPSVLDPVISASHGGSFIATKHASSSTLPYLQLIPHCTLLTPNREEAQKLSQQSYEQWQDAPIVAEALIARGARAVLLKGGHWQGRQSIDYFSDGKQHYWIIQTRIDSHNARGTGCALASSITSALALGYSLLDAIIIGKMAIQQALQQAYSVDSTGTIIGAVACDEFPSRADCLPQFIPHNTKSSKDDWQQAPWLKKAFPPCGDQALGLYPVVDSADWLERLLPLGVTTIQLRLKNKAEGILSQEIQRSVELAKQYNARLFINDHWDLAIKHNAYGVHLGQEDLEKANLSAIYEAGLRLGISTHCHYELARAHYFQPSYIACGPIFDTDSKQMPWTPHGIEGLRYWRELIDKPLVAIGGINSKRLDDVAAAGADGIAMISAITQAEDPEATCRTLLNKFNPIASQKKIQNQNKQYADTTT